MTVRELMGLLAQVEPDRLVVFNAPYQGFTEVTTVERQILGGLDHRYSFEEVKVVEISNGDGDYRREHGADVVGFIPRPPEPQKTRLKSAAYPQGKGPA